MYNCFSSYSQSVHVTMVTHNVEPFLTSTETISSVSQYSYSKVAVNLKSQCEHSYIQSFSEVPDFWK